MNWSALGLHPEVELAARRLVEQFPHVQITSGRRTLADQARVMTVNLRRNPKWIGQTYRHGQQLQAFVDARRTLLTWDELERALLQQLTQMPNVERLSWHLTGRAFDIHPITDHEGNPTGEGRAVLTWIESELQPDRLLTWEGGLPIWHMQFTVLTREV